MWYICRTVSTCRRLEHIRGRAAEKKLNDSNGALSGTGQSSCPEDPDIDSGLGFHTHAKRSLRAAYRDEIRQLSGQSCGAQRTWRLQLSTPQLHVLPFQERAALTAQQRTEDTWKIKSPNGDERFNRPWRLFFFTTVNLPVEKPNIYEAKDLNGELADEGIAVDNK